MAIRNSSIFSSRWGWKAFFLAFAATAATALAGLYAFMLLADPYDIYPFSLPGERIQVSTNLRLNHPRLARSTEFDSVVVGTSISMLLKPDELDAAFGARFVNLSMQSASAWEQARMLELFLRHHPQPRYVIIGIDLAWYRDQTSYSRFLPDTEALGPFPDWLYDESPYNDLLPFNRRSLKEATRQFLHLAGIADFDFGEEDGYVQIMPDDDQYDVARARRHIYGYVQPIRFAPVRLEAPLGKARIDAVRYPALDILAGLLARVPSETAVILYFPPYHVHRLPQPGTNAAILLEDFKERVRTVAQTRKHTCVFDFMVPSRITERDENYWDPIHFVDEVATDLAFRMSRLCQARHYLADSARPTGTVRE